MSLFAAFMLSASAPIIDVHRHAAWPEADGGRVHGEILAEMAADGVTLSVVSVTTPDEVARWQGDPVIVGVMLGCPRNLAEPRYKCFPASEGWPDPVWLEDEIGAGRVGALFEVAPNYYGISPANPRYEPYWALAERYDIPVGVHTQRGPRPGGRHSTRADPNCCPDYDPEMGNPALLRPVLERHPGLRIWIQHVGSGAGDYGPFWEETLALLRDYPSVYLDLSITNGAMPPAQYEEALRRLIEAGFGDRIMFGSDNIPVAGIFARLDRIDWLNAGQRRAILHDNAARFFRVVADR